MKINVAKSAGFCFGVKRAIAVAYETLQQKKEVYMLGDIVHNEDVCKELSKAGIKKISKFAKGNKIRTFLIRAHGAPLKIFNNASRLSYNIVDATCPMVKEIHKIAINAEENGYKVIIIGDKKHDEVRGIVGQLKNPSIVIDDIRSIPAKDIDKINKAAVVVQSTQNIEKVTEIVETLKKQIKELVFFNTICRPTRIKQQEIKSMPLENDLMIIIGSKASANTRRLYEISKSFNKRSYWIQSKGDLRPAWFKNAKSVGITSGSSTPDKTTKDVLNNIKEITKQSF
jgi:4-hydroxy-3-methylbut-2-enyl diphosphate reductase